MSSVRQLALLLPLVLLAPAAPSVETPGFARAVALAERALAAGDWEAAREQVDRALERDPRSRRAWALRARWAEGAGERDELVYALHQELRLAAAQGVAADEVARLRGRVEGVDPVAADLLGLERTFLDRLRPVADDYEEDGRPHSAIRVHKEILALDPENAESRAAIERIASAPDPSLAADAKPKDLLAGVSLEWIAEHDATHGTWDTRAIEERETYRTQTNAGYEVLVRAAEAMDQMNAFYRVFFGYGTEEDGRAVPRIDLNLFATRDEYLELGKGPPVEWSAGHFTGDSVETYIGSGGFEGMVGTLFHEAAHQFVSLSTNAVGWLNEGLASFFEGCRILANGTVLMNLPASHRLVPLVERMERGWMSDAWDGIDEDDPAGSSPAKAPTFRIVLENDYPWGPPWYAPTWGVVYFLYNYQDPIDGRFVYRRAFREFIDTSGGRRGDGAVENFEEVVLGNPAPPTKGVELPDGVEPIALPRTTAQLDPVWKDWLTRLRDETAGRIEVERPYHAWARYAIERGDLTDAAEHFEKALIATPDDPAAHVDFAELLAEEQGDADRAVALLSRAARLLESSDEVDEERLKDVDRRIRKLDPKHRTLERVRADLVSAVTSLAQRYLAEDLNMMAMDVAWRMGNDLDLPSMFAYFEEGARRAQRSLALWRLAYDEQSLAGWDTAGNEVFSAAGETLESSFGAYDPDRFDYRFLTLDTVTSGDFSLECEVAAERGRVSFAGIVFGRKSPTDFHALLLYPPGRGENGERRPGFVDLASFYGDGAFETWRHNPVPDRGADGSASERWYRLRVDVTGRLVDVWLDDGYVATQELGSLDVLRGGFGLIAGTGATRFRNVRYLARAARDPGSLIERKLRLERVVSPEGSLDGSWLGLVPPWPRASAWLGEPREAWADAGRVPQLLVLWSIDQNEEIALDPWLRWLAETYRDVGLRIVSVTSPWSQGARVSEASLASYLTSRPFPGAVAIDQAAARADLGATFGAYAIERFFLPRLLLLDLDQRVVWEGDPGFKSGRAFDPSEPSYLRAPLDDLIARRKLREMNAWRARWESTGLRTMATGEMEQALPLLLEAREYDWRVDDAVFEAQRRLTALEAALGSIEATAADLAEREAEPALEALLAWAELLGTPVETKRSKELKSVLGSGRAKAWQRARGMLRPLERRVESGKDVGSVADVLERMRPLGGALPAELARDLTAAEGDEAALRRVLDGADRLPARWLAAELFGW